LRSPPSELTVNDAEPDLAAHAVAIGLRSYVSLAEGLEEGLVAARDAGAALVAAHPSGPVSAEEPVGAKRRSAAYSSRASRASASDEGGPPLRSVVGRWDSRRGRSRL
jgi:hypothetical protein